MKKIIRITALILLICLISAAFCACGGDEESTEAESSEVSAPKKELFEGLPDVNYGGEEFVILVPGDSFSTYASIEIMPQETSPLVLNDEIIKRNELVESRFGVKISEVRTESNENMVSLVRTEALSPTGAYDLVMPYIPDAATLAMEQSILPLNDLEYLDLEHECWDKNATEALSIGNKNYFVTGDISLLALACTHAIAFNKDVLDKAGLESPYDLVSSGEWTIDKLSEMASKITADTDGQPGMSCKDTYGFLINSNFTTSMFIGAGENLTLKNADDIPYLAVDSTSAATVFGKIFDLINDANCTGKIDDTTGTYYSTASAGGGSVWTAATESVANGNALFRAMAIIDLIDLGTYDCRFGVLPVPKLDKNQEGYRSLVSTLYATCVAIPYSSYNPEKASIIAQALCEASTDTTKNAYYNVILKLRKIQDDESEAMLDLIFGGRVYEPGIVYNWGGTSTYDSNSVGNFLNKIAFSGTQTFSSTLDSIRDMINSDIAETVDAFSD